MSIKTLKHAAESYVFEGIDTCATVEFEYDDVPVTSSGDFSVEAAAWLANMNECIGEGTLFLEVTSFLYIGALGGSAR